MKQFIVAFLTLAACGAAVAQTTFRFLEDDFRGEEANGVLQALIRREGSLNEPVVVNVRTVTKNQFVDMGFSLEDFPIINPAELNDTDFGSDFVMKDINITFFGLPNVQTLTVEIPIIDDDLDEVEEEGFIIILSIAESDPSDVVSVTRNVTRGLVIDNDDLTVTFELPELFVSEAQGSLDVYVAKQNGMKSERTVDINIDAFTHNATNGLDFYLIEGNPQTLVFSPFDQRLPVATFIIDDDIVEELEHFSVDLISAQGNDYTLGRDPRILIFIKDNDEPITPEPSPTASGPSTTPPTGATTAVVDCPDEGLTIGITFLITFLLTLLFACILWAIICALCIAWDRKRRAKGVAFAQLEQQQVEQQQTQH